MEKQYRIALLIDAENISKNYVKLVMNELSEFGVITHKRVYGDFTNPSVSSWKQNLIEFAMTPVFQFNYTKGKNASDSAMVIDAMDILYSGKVDGFCLVTSDSDFTKLAIRLREAGMLVIGMGEQKTPSSLVSACEQFKYLDLLLNKDGIEQETSMCANTETVKFQEESKPDLKTEENVAVIEDEKSLIPTREEIGEEIKLILEQKIDENGWVNQSEIGILLSKRVPGFDPRNYNYRKLSMLIESYEFLETKTVPNPKNDLLKIVYVKIK